MSSCDVLDKYCTKVRSGSSVLLISLLHVPNMQLTRLNKGGWLIPQCNWGSGVSHCHISNEFVRSYEKLQKLKMEEREAHDAMGKAMSYINEGRKKIHDRLKAGNMMEVEAGNKLIAFGR